MSEIVLVRANDWEGLYVDGALISENHSIDPHTILDLVGGKCIYLTSAQDHGLCDRGALPATLADLKELG